MANAKRRRDTANVHGNATITDNASETAERHGTRIFLDRLPAKDLQTARSGMSSRRRLSRSPTTPTLSGVSFNPRFVDPRKDRKEGDNHLTKSELGKMNHYLIASNGIGRRPREKGEFLESAGIPMMEERRLSVGATNRETSTQNLPNHG